MDRADFVARFGGVFEHSAWIAERAFDKAPPPSRLDADWLHNVLSDEFRAATEEERYGVLRAHPDLAGRLAISGELTEDSRQEQSGAGLDRLSEVEFARFTDLNTRYHARFGFPFIIAVKGLGKDSWLVNVQAHSPTAAPAANTVEDGQLLLMRRTDIDTLFGD